MPGSDDSAAVSPGLVLPLVARERASIFGVMPPSELLVRRPPAFNILVDAGTANTNNVVACVRQEICFEITLCGDDDYNGLPLIKFKNGSRLSGKEYSEVFMMFMNSDRFAIYKNGESMVWHSDGEDESLLISYSSISRCNIQHCDYLIRKNMSFALGEESSIELILNKVKLTEFEEYTDDAACSDQHDGAGSILTPPISEEDGSHSGDNYDWPPPHYF